MKFLKSILSLTLALIMIFSCCSVALGAEEKEDYPVITVCGLGYGCVKIYYEDDPEKKSLFYPFDKDRFIGNLYNIDDYIIDSVMKGDYDVLHSVIYNYLIDSFGMLALTPEGENMPGVANDDPWLRKKGDKKYEFVCDNRQNPFILAAQLRDAIDEVKAKHGTDKVELIGSSYGANVVAAYVYTYPEECNELDTVMLRVPSIGGVNFIGELFSGNLTVNPKAFCDLIEDLAGEGIIPDFLYIMEEAGVLGVFLEALALPVLRKAIYEAVVDAGREFLVTFPALWVCIPDEYFEKAMIFVHGENYKDPDHKYAKLISDMTFYHYEIANKVVDLFTELEKNNEGLNVAMIAKFGNAAIPLSSGEPVIDDGFVTVPVASFGATCANYGEKLPKDYVQQRYPEYNLMSPEWNIDASTGAFPFRTWYVKGIDHTGDNKDFLTLVDEIVFEDIDIFSKPNRSQFLTVSEENPDLLVPIVAEEEKELTFFEMLLEFFRKFLIIPRTIIENLLKGKDISIIK